MDLRNIPCEVIKDEAGSLLLLYADTAELLLTSGGDPVTSFVPGWHPTTINFSLPPLRLLSFVGPRAETAVWIMDERNRRLGDKLEHISGKYYESIKSTIIPIFTKIVEEVIVGLCIVDDTGLSALLDLDLGLRLELIEAIHPAVLREGRVKTLNQLEDFTLLSEVDQKKSKVCKEFVAEGFATTFQQAIINSSEIGILFWPSPIDGTPVPCAGSIMFDDFRFAYKFIDKGNGLAFYVIASDHMCKTLALYIPYGGLIITPTAWTEHLLTVYFPQGLARWFSSHCLVWASELIAYFNSEPHVICSVMRGRPGVHLGHQLWNELSGIENYIQKATGRMVPKWLVPQAGEDIESWGLIDHLFPEIVNSVIRIDDGGTRLIKYIYENRICATRVTSDFISENLRGRLKTSKPVLHYLNLVDRKHLEKGGDKERPIIIFGLRVENRTLVDVGGFFVRITGLLSKLLPNAIVVFDGHNSRSSFQESSVLESGEFDILSIDSHGEAIASKSPLQVERNIVAKVRSALGESGVEVIDTLGTPIAHSLAWTFRAGCFLSIWGAGLSKYRWGCNTPGFIITSNANLSSRDDLRIYDSPEYIEKPTNVVFISRKLVTDVPTAEHLVPVAINNPYYANFVVDEDGFWNEFKSFVEEVWTR